MKLRTKKESLELTQYGVKADTIATYGVSVKQIKNDIAIIKEKPKTKSPNLYSAKFYLVKINRHKHKLEQLTKKVDTFQKAYQELIKRSTLC